MKLIDIIIMKGSKRCINTKIRYDVINTKESHTIYDLDDRLLVRCITASIKRARYIAKSLI